MFHHQIGNISSVAHPMPRLFVGALVSCSIAACGGLLDGNDQPGKPAATTPPDVDAALVVTADGGAQPAGADASSSADAAAADAWAGTDAGSPSDAQPGDAPAADASLPTDAAAYAQCDGTGNVFYVDSRDGFPLI